MRGPSDVFSSERVAELRCRSNGVAWVLKSAIKTLVLAALAGVLFIAVFFYFLVHAGLGRPDCDAGLFMGTCIE